MKSHLVFKQCYRVDLLNILKSTIKPVFSGHCIKESSVSSSHVRGPEVIKLFSCSTQLSMEFLKLKSMKISRRSAFFRIR